MKRLLFALGVLMMLIGGSCIFSGYPIVEVERGWTLTICGATAMTGGAIVIALGFFLVRLETLATGLREAFADAIAVAPVAASFDAGSSPPQSSPSRSPVSHSSASQPPAPPPPAPFPLSRPAPAPPPAEFAPPERLPPRRTPDFLKVRREEGGARSQVESAETAWARPSEPAPVREPPPPAEAAAPAPLEPPPPPAPAVPMRTPPVETMQDAPPPRDEPPTGPLFKRFPVRSLTLPRGTWPDAPATVGARPAPAPAPVATEAAAPVTAKEKALLAELLPAALIAPVVPVALDGRPRAETPPAIGAEAEAWFERALAGLDEDIAPRTAVAPKPEAPSEQVANVEPAQQAEGVESLPSESQAPAVIGRYETEGTLYVMYADGSIEAQTATGVYRFASLSELKAHIESLN